MDTILKIDWTSRFHSIAFCGALGLIAAVVFGAF